MKPLFAVLNRTQSLLLGTLRRQGTGVTAPAPLGPDCGNPSDAPPSRVRRHRQTPARGGLPTFLTSSPPGRGPRRVGSGGQGRAKPPPTTISPGVPLRSRRGRRALPGTGSLLPAGTTPAARILRGTTGAPLPVPLIPPELPEQGWRLTRAAPRRGAPRAPAGSASIRLLRPAAAKPQGSLGGKGSRRREDHPRHPPHHRCPQP